MVGCALSLPIYWWLFVSPLVRLAKCLQPRNTPSLRELVDEKQLQELKHFISMSVAAF